MLLAVDVGNTQTHLGIFRGDELVEHWRFATVRESTADELGAALRDLLALRGLSLRRPRRVDRLVGRARSSSPSTSSWPSATSGHGMLLVGPGLKTGMPIRIDNPRELGADRLVNAVAAYDRFGAAVHRRRLRHRDQLRRRLGRGRVPGRRHRAGRRDLAGGAAPSAPPAARASTSRRRAALIGKGTIDAIRSGVVYGFAGQVDGIVGRLREELGDEATAIATGGLAERIVPFCEHDRRGRRPADPHRPAADLRATMRRP